MTAEFLNDMIVKGMAASLEASAERIQRLTVERDVLQVLAITAAKFIESNYTNLYGIVEPPAWVREFVAKLRGES